MEKIALILIHNIFVTKSFFRNENQKHFLTHTFLVDPTANRHIFKSGLNLAISELWSHCVLVAR